MAIIDVVKYQPKDNEYVFKFPSEDLRIGTQVIVNPAQHAFFIKGGEILDEFTSGTHTLKTENIPLLNKIINIPFGGNSPFKAEIWFVNLLSKLDNKWGTTSPITLEDPKYGIIIPVRAFGQYGFKISNPKLFMQTLSGGLKSFTADKIQEFFKGKIISSLTALISKKLVLENVSILEVGILLEELSSFCEDKIKVEFSKFGIEIINFYFMSINVPQDDPSVIKLKEAKDLVAKVKITGKDLYQLDRSFNVLDKAAQNDGGVAGNLMGAGIGLSAGLTIGSQMSGISNILSTVNSNQPPATPITKYFVLIDNKQNGPFELLEVKKMIIENKITRQTLAWKSDLDEWVPINQLSELTILFSQIPPPPPNI
jgi:membrane protease subunit (stomatin/prohibitin family)